MARLLMARAADRRLFWSVKTHHSDLVDYVQAAPLRSTLIGRSRAGVAVKAVDMVVDMPSMVQHRPDVLAAFVTVTPMIAAPECLLSLDIEDLQQAPALVDVHSSVPTFLAAALAEGNSAKMEAAACLAAPVVLEENAGEILRASVSELALKAQARLESR
jgi:hypothetical protein